MRNKLKPQTDVFSLQLQGVAELYLGERWQQRGGRARREEGGLGGKETRRGVGIIELSAQWSDGGHVVPLMEEEMSFLAELIVQKRAEPLFREALLLSQCTYMRHTI